MCKSKQKGPGRQDLPQLGIQVVQEGKEEQEQGSDASRLYALQSNDVYHH